MLLKVDRLRELSFTWRALYDEAYAAEKPSRVTFRIEPRGEVSKLTIVHDDFEPDSYTDEVRERVLALIQQKVDGEEITLAPTEEPKTQIIDLMAALKASLAAGSDEAASDEKPVKKAASKKKASKKAS